MSWQYRTLPLWASGHDVRVPIVAEGFCVSFRAPSRKEIIDPLARDARAVETSLGQDGLNHVQRARVFGRDRWALDQVL